MSTIDRDGNPIQYEDGIHKVNEPITEGSVERFIKEAQSRKLVNFQVVDFFFRYFDIDSLDELSQKELNLANKKLAQHRLPTIDGSDVPLHSEQTQDDLLKKRIGN